MPAGIDKRVFGGEGISDGAKGGCPLNSSGRDRDSVCLQIRSQGERTLCPAVVIGGGARDTECATAPGDGKNHRNPCKHGTVLILRFNHEWIR